MTGDPGGGDSAPASLRTLARPIAAQVCIHAAMTGMRMAAPLLALQSGYGPAAVGFLLALFALTQVFLALPAGRYADRHGLKRPVRLAVLAASGGAALALAFPVFAALCVAALLTGGATGVATIALQRHVGRAAHGAAQLRSVFSWMAIGPAVANFLGPFSAGLLIDYAGAEAGSLAGFRASFALLALLPLVTWLLVRAVRELPPVAAPVGGPRPRAWDLLADARFSRLLLVNWLLSSCWDVHTFVVPLLGHERGLSASSIGTILGVFAMAAAAIRLVIPLVAERLHEATVVAGAMVAAALLFGVYPFLHTAMLMGACSALLGLALGSVQPMVMSLLHQITPEHRHGEALGLRVMAINASSVAMPLMFGSVGAAIGVGGLFWIVGAAVGLGSGVARRLRA
ncbi:MFS transporter [Melaminivora suipulveris]|uniref:MFS transporter n=1 Tax=Melaminivora suipulveris TaxID=2109913 RepID=A0A2R3QFE5_9BURK|nr:MFS transporter [Melaminivora suipulveris]AVO50501.1 MFS transporter [Melaminivora suipulveris]